MTVSCLSISFSCSSPTFASNPTVMIFQASCKGLFVLVVYFAFHLARWAKLFLVIQFGVSVVGCFRFDGVIYLLKW